MGCELRRLFSTNGHTCCLIRGITQLTTRGKGERLKGSCCHHVLWQVYKIHRTLSGVVCCPLHRSQHFALLSQRGNQVCLRRPPQPLCVVLRRHRRRRSAGKLLGTLSTTESLSSWMAVRVLLTGSFLECLPVNPADVVSVAALPCESGISLGCVKLFLLISVDVVWIKSFTLEWTLCSPKLFLYSLKKQPLFKIWEAIEFLRAGLAATSHLLPGAEESGLVPREQSGV